MPRTASNAVPDQISIAVEFSAQAFQISDPVIVVVGSGASEGQFLQNLNSDGICRAGLSNSVAAAIALSPLGTNLDRQTIIGAGGNYRLVATGQESYAVTSNDLSQFSDGVAPPSRLSGGTVGSHEVGGGAAPNGTPEVRIDTGNSASGLTSPIVSVDGANPAGVVLTVSGVASGYSGTVTFTDAGGQQDVVKIAGDGTYSANLSNLTEGTLAYLMTVKNAAGQVINVDPTATLGDGSANAPAGAPELPNLLNGLAVRPSWEVAGVDYHVGVPSGTTLLDPATIKMAGVSVNTSSHVIMITGNNVTLSGYDFSLGGGYNIYITGGATNTTIENSNFMVGANNHVPIQADGTAKNLTILNNIFDGGGTTSNGNSNSVWAMVSYNGSGTFTAEYNVFQNTPSDAIDFSGGSASMTPVVEYNVFDNLGTASGSHPDTVQFVGGVVNNAVISYNTIYQPVNGGEVGGGEGIQICAQDGGSITNTTVDNNTVVAPGPSLTQSYSIAIQSGSGVTNNIGTVENNYIDFAGAYGAFYPIGGANSVTNYSFSGNVDMTTGNVVNGNNSETPAVTDVVASPASGTELQGAKIIFTIDFSKAVTVSGVPTLTLNDGGTATYTGGSGSKALTFAYTVSSSDNSVPALAITAVNLPNGVAITNGGTSAYLESALATFSGLAIDTPATVTAIVDSPSNGGYLDAGEAVTLKLDFNKKVTVTKGIPTLTLNDGGVATYTGGSGTNVLSFSYTVATGQNTNSLAAKAVILNGARITDSGGDSADRSLSGPTQSGPEIDTTPPVVAIADPTKLTNSTATLTGTDSDNFGVDSVEIFDGGVDLGAARLDRVGSWTFTAALSAGNYDNLTAVATDMAGNTATADASFSLTVQGGIVGRQYTSSESFYGSSNQLIEEIFKRADNSVYEVAHFRVTAEPYVKTNSYYSDSNVLTSEGFKRADGSKYETARFAITGKPYVRTNSYYSDGNVLISEGFKRSDGSKYETARFAITGKPYVTTDSYYSDGNVLISEGFKRSDGSKYETARFAITGKPYVTTDSYYSDGNVLISEGFKRSDGSKYETARFAITGKPYVTTDSYYSDSNVLISEGFKRADGSKYETAKFAITGKPYVTTDSYYSDSNVLTSESFRRANGSYYAIAHFGLSGRLYTSYTDYYDLRDDLTHTIRNNTNGSHTITARESGVTLTGDSDGKDIFVFDAGFVQGAIRGLRAQLSGSSHDTVSLSKSDFADFAALLADAKDVGGNAVITAGNGDQLTLEGMTKALLSANSGDFTFHA